MAHYIASTALLIATTLSIPSDECNFYVERYPQPPFKEMVTHPLGVCTGTQYDHSKIKAESVMYRCSRDKSHVIQYKYTDSSQCTGEYLAYTATRNPTDFSCDYAETCPYIITKVHNEAEGDDLRNWYSSSWVKDSCSNGQLFSCDDNSAYTHHVFDNEDCDGEAISTNVYAADKYELFCNMADSDSQPAKLPDNAMTADIAEQDILDESEENVDDVADNETSQEQEEEEEQEEMQQQEEQEDEDEDEQVDESENAQDEDETEEGIEDGENEDEETANEQEAEEEQSENEADDDDEEEEANDDENEENFDGDDDEQMDDENENEENDQTDEQNDDEQQQQNDENEQDDEQIDENEDNDQEEDNVEEDEDEIDVEEEVEMEPHIDAYIETAICLHGRTEGQHQEIGNENVPYCFTEYDSVSNKPIYKGEFGEIKWTQSAGSYGGSYGLFLYDSGEDWPIAYCFSDDTKDISVCDKQWFVDHGTSARYYKDTTMESKECECTLEGMDIFDISTTPIPDDDGSADDGDDDDESADPAASTSTTAAWSTVSSTGDETVPSADVKPMEESKANSINICFSMIMSGLVWLNIAF